ncbi:MAG: response regulator transcription factor [Chloroflexi bacterium]|nr:response regulator transcription factor [Chloroflexota bacterium]
MDVTELTQMGRQHIFCVNSDPPFLDLLRELLQDERYNVTTTNFVPQTFDQIASLQPALLIVDLVVFQQAGWDLLERLRADATTHRIPVIITSTNPPLLKRAQADPARYGGPSSLVVPFDVADLLAAVDSLIGAA